jgi:hypothetical protein
MLLRCEKLLKAGIVADRVADRINVDRISLAVKGEVNSVQCSQGTKIIRMLRRDLDQQPADNRVGDRNLVNVAPL